MFDLNPLLIALAGLAAGLINALAGGGTLVSFPALTALGIPAVAASVTNTVALVPGYLGATLAQWQDIRAQKARLSYLLPASALGGLMGGWLLLNTGEKLFREIVPYLILLASLLLAAQDPVRAWVLRRIEHANAHAARENWLIALPVGLGAIYGGYFGAGLSVIVLAVLGVVLEDTLTRLNALKQAIAFSGNLAAAIFFLFSGQVDWGAAALMALGALAGGALGGRFAGQVKPAVLRWVVVLVGLVVAVFYWVG